MVEFPGPAARDSGTFFERVFGWPHLEYGPDYVDVQAGEEQTLGFQQDEHEAPRAPLVVLEVEDLAATRAAIESAGGTVTVESFDFPGGRRFHFREPSGNELAVWVRSES